MRNTPHKVIIAISIFYVLLLSGCQSSTDIYKAGKYTAGAEGYAGEVMVQVEFSNDQILTVEIISHTETKGFGDKAIDRLPEIILENQSYEVDAISGATVTGDAIKAAVKDCMAQAEV